MRFNWGIIPGESSALDGSCWHCYYYVIPGGCCALILIATYPADENSGDVICDDIMAISTHAEHWLPHLD